MFSGGENMFSVVKKILFSLFFLLDRLWTCWEKSPLKSVTSINTLQAFIINNYLLTFLL